MRLQRRNSLGREVEICSRARTFTIAHSFAGLAARRDGPVARSTHLQTQSIFFKGG